MSRLERYGNKWRLEELERAVGVWLLTEIADRDDRIELRDGYRHRLISDDDGQRCVLVRGNFTPAEAELVPQRIGAALKHLAETALALYEAPFFVDNITSEEAAAILEDERRSLRGH